MSHSFVIGCGTIVTLARHAYWLGFEVSSLNQTNAKASGRGRNEGVDSPLEMPNPSLNQARGRTT